MLDGHNLKETRKNVTQHAEIIAINKASKKLQNWRLSLCDMYVTLEPCTMCMGAIRASRIRKLYIGTMDEKLNNPNPEPVVESGILKNESEYILKEFFKTLRKRK